MLEWPKRQIGAAQSSLNSNFFDFLGLATVECDNQTIIHEEQKFISPLLHKVQNVEMLVRAHIVLKISHTTWNPCRIHRGKPNKTALLPSADCTPPLLELHVQLRRLQNANEHENEPTPSEETLHKPPEWLRWESGELAARAVAGIPECAAPPVGPTLVCTALSRSPICPRGETVSC